MGRIMNWLRRLGTNRVPGLGGLLLVKDVESSGADRRSCGRTKPTEHGSSRFRFGDGCEIPHAGHPVLG
jgi:hypothetical protein